MRYRYALRAGFANAQAKALSRMNTPTSAHICDKKIKL
jgi:hypothetical protein